jgi:hypothetical protein
MPFRGDLNKFLPNLGLGIGDVAGLGIGDVAGLGIGEGMGLRAGDRDVGIGSLGGGRLRVEGERLDSVTTIELDTSVEPAGCVCGSRERGDLRDGGPVGGAPVGGAPSSAPVGGGPMSGATVGGALIRGGFAGGGAEPVAVEEIPATVAFDCNGLCRGCADVPGCVFS